MTLVLCLFFGQFGAHRFYTGHVLSGFGQLFTWGGFWIWALVDLVMILTGSFKDKQGLPLKK